MSLRVLVTSIASRRVMNDRRSARGSGKQVPDPLAVCPRRSVGQPRPWTWFRHSVPGLIAACLSGSVFASSPTSAPAQGEDGSFRSSPATGTCQGRPGPELSSSKSPSTLREAPWLGTRLRGPPTSPTAADSRGTRQFEGTIGRIADTERAVDSPELREKHPFQLW